MRQRLMDRWSATGFLVVALMAVTIIAIAAGWRPQPVGVNGEGLAPHVTILRGFARGAPFVAAYVLASMLAGALIGWTVGPSLAVGAHLGLYNLATPAAVWLRVRWLTRHRPGFIIRGWFPLFVLVWAVLLGLSLFCLRLVKGV